MPSDISEHSPLSALDEQMVHQQPAPMRQMWTTDPKTYERYWFAMHDTKGELLIVQGCGFYPGLDTAEAYSITVCRGMHSTTRAHRRLGDDRMNTELGPIKVEIVVPFRDVRLTLTENAQGVTYDLHFKDTTRAVFRQIGYETFGRVSGWVNVRGERFELDGVDFRGTRDHHWGTRNGVGGPAFYKPAPDERILGLLGTDQVQFQEFELDNWAMWIYHVLYPIGDPRPEAGPRVLRRELKGRFHPLSRVFEEAVVHYWLDDGQEKEAHFLRLGDQSACLRHGMYPQGGGTPDRGIWQGMYVGDNVVEGETINVADHQQLIRSNGLHDNAVVVSCEGKTTYGIFESVDPVLYDYCREGMRGYSLLP